MLIASAVQCSICSLSSLAGRDVEARRKQLHRMEAGSQLAVESNEYRYACRGGNQRRGINGECSLINHVLKDGEPAS